MNKIWVRANHDPRTGKPLPTWMPEKDWLNKADVQHNQLPHGGEE